MKPFVVSGDSMLDVDIEGSANRLSPEAPVPVVEPDRIWQRPGGAGLAAVLASREHPSVVLITATADDPTGGTLARLFAEDYPGIQVMGIPLCGGTVSKIRVRAGGQSVVRIDHGDGYAANDRLPDQIRAVLADAATVCVADYGRGVAANDRLRTELAAVAEHVPVVWDPHARGAPPISGCGPVSPNQGEARVPSPETSAGRHADVLRKRWKAAAVSVTLGRQAHPGRHQGVLCGQQRRRRAYRSYDMAQRAATGGARSKPAHPGHFEQASSLVTASAVEQAVPCGPDAKAYLERIRQFTDAGFDEVYVQQIGPDQDSFFDFFEAEIAPEFAG